MSSTMSDDVLSLIGQMVGPRAICSTGFPNVIYLSERVNEETRIALLTKFLRRYTHSYLILDLVDADVLDTSTQYVQLIGNCLYRVHNEQNIGLLYPQLYRGNWLLFFRNKPVGEGLSIPEGFGLPLVISQSLVKLDIELMVASGPDDMEWTVGWHPNQ